MNTIRQIYLDHAAATPTDTAVLAAMQPYYAQQYYNPSSLYGAARQVKSAIEDARRMVAACLGARPAEVIFTAGATEANNLAVTGVMRRYPDTRVLLSAIEHDSVLTAGRQYEHGIIPVTRQGIVDPAVLADMIDDRTVLVCVMYANNEIGSVQPIRDIGRLIGAVRRQRQERGVATPLYLLVDAAQAANYLDLQVARLGADMLTLNGGKIYGPKQSGALYIRAGIELEPLIAGGGQEQGLRSGTENVPGIIGFAHALQLTQRQRASESQRLTDIRDEFIRNLRQVIPAVGINGSERRRLPNNVHITIPGADNERLLYELDERGIMAAAGSACSAASGEPSHVLAAIDLSPADAQGSLRLTLGRTTTPADMAATLDALRVIAE